MNIEYTEVDQKWFQKIMFSGERLGDSVCDCCQHTYFIIYTIIFNIVNITFFCLCSGDYGMFLIKFVEYLMHNHPMDTLTSECMDWFREKMALELFFHKELPM